MQLRSFALEHLEDRALFSVAAPMCAAPITATDAMQAISIAVAASHTPLTTAFNVAGTFTHPLGNPDTGSEYIFKGAGKTNTLGKFVLTGYVRPPGLIANGHANGVFILTNSSGRIRLAVTGPANPGSLPSSLSYSIVKGTGAYVGSTGSGTLGVSASGTTLKFLFRFHPAN